MAILVLFLALCGGLLYRVRGGWGDWSGIDKIFGDNVITHDMSGRLFAWALPTSMMVLSLSRNFCSGIILAVVTVVLTFFGIMVGWGT